MENQEIIKERNELAKQIYCNNQSMRTWACVSSANAMMRELYGDNWLNQPTVVKPSTPAQIVSVAEKDGLLGVRLCVGDVNIFIEAHNLDNGEKFEWKKAMARLEEVGKRTFDKHEMYLIAAYKDEINAKLKEIGGEELDGYYWSSTECSSSIAWYVYFSSGNINNNNKNNSYVVRPCAALKIKS